MKVTETPLAAMGDRVLRGGVCSAWGLLAVEGEVGVEGRSKPVLPQGLIKPYKHMIFMSQLNPLCTLIHNSSTSLTPEYKSANSVVPLSQVARNHTKVRNICQGQP